MKVIKQSTYETCLPACLLMLTNQAPNVKEEIRIWKSGWKFNYLSGQLNYLSNHGYRFTVDIENKYYFHDLSKVIRRGTTLVRSQITQQHLKKRIANGPCVVYVDNYVFAKITHAPHFILALKEKNGEVMIADPWDGKIRKVLLKDIMRGIMSLRKHLLYSPVLITNFK